MTDQPELRTWGGKRPGAGRKKSPDRRDPPHRARPVHDGRFPLHVLMRALPEVGRLRRPEVLEAARRALGVIAARADFRVVHLSIQSDHVHLLVEADDGTALDSGMRALSISLARRINAALRRRGKVFEFRYHTTTLRTPAEARAALAYVLVNWRRHGEDEPGIDRYASASAFTGWADAAPEGHDALPVVSPQTWLLAEGWRRGGELIRTTEVPGPLVAA